MLDHDSLGFSCGSRCPEQISQVFATDLRRRDAITWFGSNTRLAISEPVYQDDPNIL
jgi:hypothetical protein